MANPLNPDNVLNGFLITDSDADAATSVDSAVWSITGDTDVEEGGTASFTLSLDGTVSTGETATIDLIVSNIDTRFADYADLLTTMQNATALRDDLVYQDSLLTYTGDGSPMEDLVINLDIVDDTLSEDAEVFLVTLTGAVGTGISIDPTSAVVTTTIAASDQGPNENSAVWSITGDTDVEEGGTASYTLSLTGMVSAGETATIDLIVSNIDTRFADFADPTSAIQDAVALRDDLVYENSLLIYTGDGSAMEDLVINLDIVDDTLSEDAEDFSVSLTGAAGTGISIDPTGAIVTTTIAASDQGPNENSVVWSITGDTDVEEGGTASFTLSLTGIVLAGETATVDLKFSNIDTRLADFVNPLAALPDAVALRDDLVYENSLLTYIGDGSPMEDLVVNLDVADDDLLEDAEDFSVSLYDAAGTGVTIDPTSAVVTTTIAASDQGPNENSAVWSITGDTDVEEGGTASYTLSLTGTVLVGDTATIDLILSNIDTRFADFADPTAAMQDAVALRDDLVYENSLLIYTGDGSAMEDLVINLDIVDDTLSEEAEGFSVSLTGAAGTGITIDPTSAVVTTTIGASDQGTSSEPNVGTEGDFLIGTQNGDLNFGDGENQFVASSGEVSVGEDATREIDFTGISTTEDFSFAIA